MTSAQTFNFAAHFQIVANAVVIEDAETVDDCNGMACGLYDL
jgi:hypothetical protein